MENSGTVLHRRHIDSGISEGRASGEGDENVAMESLEEEVFISENTNTEKLPSNKTELSAGIVIKERLLKTAKQLAFGGKCLGIALLVYLVGYFEFSFLWLVIGIFIFTWREHKRRKKQATMEVLGSIAENERKYLQAVKDVYKLSGKDLPSWVYFPDAEKAEWLNRVLQQLWPYVCDYVKSTIFEKVEPSICSSSKLLKNFKFSKLDLGEKAPRVGGVKVYSDSRTRRSEIVLDIQIIYQSDVNIQVKINGLSAGVKTLTVRGLLRVELRPLVSKIPLVGAVSVAFVHEPSIDFDLTNLGNLLDVPGIDLALRSAISDCINSMMVLPERYVLKLADDIDISELMYPMPKGVVRIHILEARNLEEKDRKILGVGGGSDPYVEIKVGRNLEFRTKTIEHNVNPVWNERFEAPVMDTLSSSIEITLYDDDGALTKADYLGSATVPIQSVYDNGIIDEWIPLCQVKHGSIHVKVEWLELSDDPSLLTEAMEHAGQHDLNSALLNVYIDSAKDLPCKTCSSPGLSVVNQIQGFVEGKYEPSPLVKISIPGYRKPFKTKVAANTNNPVWEENFRALIQNPRMDSLTFKVKDAEDKEEVLGSIRVKINQLLEAPNMTRDEPFHLSSSGPKSQLNMRLTARLLLPRKPGHREKYGKTAFMVAGPGKSSKAKPSPEPKKPEAEIPILSTAKEDNLLDNSDSTGDDSGVLEHSSSNDLGINFANSPTHGSNGTEPSRSSSFKSNLSSVNGGRESKERLDRSDREGTESPRGRLRLTLTHSPEKGKLFIDVHEAEKLIVCDEENNTSDPYVRIYLLPHRRASQKRKTKVVKNSINPVFNEKIEYDVLKGDLHDRQLDISVKNKTGILSSEQVLMGVILINLADYKFDEPISKWFPLQPRSEKED